jgi:transposase
MTRRQKDPLRPLTDEECTWLERISRATSESASHVARAKALLAVAAGQTYTAAAQAAGRRSGDAVAQLVTRFNREGINALVPGHGGGQPMTYTFTEQERILAEARRMPDREADGAATWSLVTLQRALRDAGWSWQQSRTWCETGTAVRQRKSGPVEVHDPDTEAKKT